MADADFKQTKFQKHMGAGTVIFRVLQKNSHTRTTGLIDDLGLSTFVDFLEFSHRTVNKVQALEDYLIFQTFKL